MEPAAEETAAADTRALKRFSYLNLSRLGEPAVEVANVVGPICETGDTLGHERPLPRSEEGDGMLIANAGAYGRAMSSEYNLRPPAAERVLP